MAKQPYLPKDDAGKLLWLTNFAAKLPQYQSALGLVAADVTAVVLVLLESGFLFFMTGMAGTGEHSQPTSYSSTIMLALVTLMAASIWSFVLFRREKDVR